MVPAWIANQTGLENERRLPVFWQGRDSETLSLKKYRYDRIKICRHAIFVPLTRVENNVEKGEIARYEQFLLFPQCFEKTCTADT